MTDRDPFKQLSEPWPEGRRFHSIRHERLFRESGAQDKYSVFIENGTYGFVGDSPEEVAMTATCALRNGELGRYPDAELQAVPDSWLQRALIADIQHVVDTQKDNS